MFFVTEAMLAARGCHRLQQPFVSTLLEAKGQWRSGLRATREADKRGCERKAADPSCQFTGPRSQTTCSFCIADQHWCASPSAPPILSLQSSLASFHMQSCPSNIIGVKTVLALHFDISLASQTSNMVRSISSLEMQGRWSQSESLKSQNRGLCRRQIALYLSKARVFPIASDVTRESCFSP